MNPFLLRLADGTSYIVGMLMVSVGLLALLWTKSRAVRLLLTICILIGVLFVIISSTPISLWLYILWGLLSCASLILYQFKHLPVKFDKVKFITTIVTMIMCLLLMSFELSYYLAPTIPIEEDQAIYVIGDSLSAGINKQEKNWPGILAEIAGLDIVNLAQAGAQMDQALKQMEKIPTDKAIVIVEIGGNDLLGQSDASVFRNQLNDLLKFLRSQNHQIIMCELPLLPFHNSFGRAQRDLAKQYEVTLIPKRFLTNVFGMKNGTLDGIHLSEKGHKALADSVRDILVIE